MKILFYSSNSNYFDYNTFKIFSYPTCKMDFEKLQNDFPRHEFFVVAELPAMFLIDIENNGTVEKSCTEIFSSELKIKYFPLEAFSTVPLFSKSIKNMAGSSATTKNSC